MRPSSTSSVSSDGQPSSSSSPSASSTASSSTSSSSAASSSTSSSTSSSASSSTSSSASSSAGPSSLSNSSSAVPSSSSSSSATPAAVSSSSSSSAPGTPSSSSAPHQPNAASIAAIGNPYSNIVSNAAVLSKCPNLPDSFLLEVINRKKTRQLTKRRSVASLHVAFKIYKLESNGKGLQAVRLKRSKMNLMSEAFGFKHKNSIEYSKIKNIVRTSDKSVTVVYEPFLGKTLFFRNAEDAEEFYGLATSLVEAGTREKRKSTTGVPISSPTLSIADRPAELPKEEEHDEELKGLILGLAKRMEMRKGEYLMEEGDLYQRIYTILSGEVHAVRGGVTLGIMKEGEVIGLPTLLHLRPCPTSLVVASDTATILMLPAYKIIEIAKANVPLAARLYKRAAATLQSQIEGALRCTRERAAELSASQGELIGDRHPAQEPPAPRSRDSFSAESASYSSSPTSSPASSPPASPTPLKAPLSPALLSA